MAKKRTTDELRKLDQKTLEVAEVFAEEQLTFDRGPGEPPLAQPVTAPPVDPDITGGDVDASADDAAFVGEEAPGMGNPTPDQDDVREIGRAMGVLYNDDEPLDIERKIQRRDDERWELDPASSSDYPSRKHEQEGSHRSSGRRGSAKDEQR